MQADSVYPQNGCSHIHTVPVFERSGAYFHQVAWIVLRCLDCAAELDRKKLTRGEREAVNR